HILGRAFVFCLVAHRRFPSFRMVWICARYRGLKAKNQGASEPTQFRCVSRGPFDIKSNFTLIAGFACEKAAAREPLPG
ncbi:hypothetical protein, partial [Mesorhizobium sp. M4A.F.Ca.ET.050.02.1.1]|uniref:hypothetical protein n=1 Tax=Mesorhizobium sp. M4A.F.Ca.ET.050.02.1.1 TaxID=2496754 RepID=UPI001AECBA34